MRDFKSEKEYHEWVDKVADTIASGIFCGVILALIVVFIYKISFPQ